MVLMDSFNNSKEDKTIEALIVKQKGGGSVIDRRPCFSANGKLLFVVWGQAIRSYSTETGELVRDYDGLDSKAVGVQLHPTDPNLLFACTEKGQLLKWEWQKKLPAKCVNLPLTEGYTVTCFHLLRIPSAKASQCTVIVSISNRIKRHAHVLAFGSSGQKLWKKALEIKMDRLEHSTAFGCGEDKVLLAGICGKALYVASISSSHYSEATKYKVSVGGTLTCVTCHPTEPSVLTGDATGRVLLWQGFHSKAGPVWAEYHWHTLPVMSLAFSYAGRHFFSVGGEGVLVKWTADSPNQRSFLPRLPAPLRHVVVGPENVYIAISTEDNAIQIVNSLLKLHSSIQHFSLRDIPKQSYSSLYPAGLTTDPRTEALVFNGRTGYVQFFSAHNNALLYVVHITGQNLLTQLRNKIIVNTDVTQLALSFDGHWLATAEHRDDGVNSPELRLKFWEYDHVKQTYSLNTSVEQPHNNKVLDLKFQPTFDTKQLLAITTGDDLKFRVWSLVDNPNMYGKGQVWCNDGVGYYRHLLPGPISFSTDGSLLAAAFGPTLTVWVPETINLKCSLTVPNAEHNIRQVEFGRIDCLHLVVTGSAAGVAVWNLLSLSLIWVAPLSLSLLVADPRSNLMAAFTTTNDLVIFSPSSPEPVYQHHSLLANSKSKVLAAAFVSCPKQTSRRKSTWLRHSQLYFLNSEQELLTLEHPQDADNSNDSKKLDSISISSQPPLTAFGALVAQKISSDVSQVTREYHWKLGVPEAKSIKELLVAPAHTMPSISLLCRPLLLSFIQKSASRRGEKLSQAEKASIPETESVDSDVDSDEEDLSVRKEQEEELQSYKREEGILAQPLKLADQETKLTPILQDSMQWTVTLASTS